MWLLPEDLVHEGRGLVKAALAGMRKKQGTLLALRTE
jgi:hypothetical protein